MAGRNQEGVQMRKEKKERKKEWDATWLSNATASFVSAAGQIVLFAFETSHWTGRVVSGAGTD